MLQIYIRTVDLNGKLLNTAITAGGFGSYAEAKRHLDKTIEENKPDAGYNDENDYWWIRQGETIDRYTIGQ